MGTTLMLPWLLVAAQGAVHAGPPIWRVEKKEKFCSMGTGFADGTALKIEYYPVPDLYHVVVGGPATKPLADKQKVDLEFGSKRELRFQASGVKQDADRAAVAYAQISDPAMANRRQGQQLTNREFERFWRSRGEISIRVADRQAVTVQNGDSTRAFDQLVSCADKFSPLGRSPATFRVNYDIKSNGARKRHVDGRN